MNDIGFFRRSKGTLIGTEFFAKSVSGSLVKIDQSNGDITVYSQRVNYITVPKTGTGITTHRAAFNTEVTAPAAFSTDMSAHSSRYSVSGTSFTPNASGASVGVQCVMLLLSSPVPVQLGDRICFSVQSNIGTDGIKWARLVNGAGAVIGFEDTPSSVAGSRAFEVTATTNASPGIYTNAFVEYLVDLRVGNPFVNEKLLAERNYLGSYFDGDTIRGGWLIDASSVSDYRWAGAANNSVSLFAEDYERTKAIVNELLFDVLPITEESKYTIVAYNAVPGF